MPYADPIAAKLYQRRYKQRPEARERHRQQVARARAVRKERGERERESTVAPIRALQNVIQNWSRA